MEPVLFSKGQYLQSLLLQKGNPLLLVGCPVCLALDVVVASPLCLVELDGLPGGTTFVVGDKKSVMELCLEVPATGSGAVAEGAGPTVVTKSGSAPS